MFDDALTPPDRSPDEYTGPSLLSAPPGFPSRGGSPLPPPPGGPSSGGNGSDVFEELRQARREIELLKLMDPLRAADMAIELQVEKMRAIEATSARDSAVQRLASAYDSIKEKALAIGRLQSEKSELEHRLIEADNRVKEAAEQARAEERKAAEDEMQRLREVICKLKESDEVQKNGTCGSTPQSSVEATSASALFAGVDDSFSFSTAVESNDNIDKALQPITNDIDRLAIGPRPHSVSAFHGTNSSVAASPYLKLADSHAFHMVSSNSRDPADMMRARDAVLASLPIPSGIPDDVLKPIMIPTPFTIHEFLGNTTGSLRNSLAGYRAFHDKTTYWCSEREEHGYFLAPLFKCSTKPRVPTAHTWSEVDPRGRMTKATECFFNREGKWYYAGQYVALRLEDFNTKEWEVLDPEASSMLVKETLVGRKNTSPTVHYEVSQLYAAGALKIACVGLQCVGFNSGLYHTIMEQAAKCQQSGRWKVGWGNSDFPTVDGSDAVGGHVSVNGNGDSYPPTLFNFM